MPANSLNIESISDFVEATLDEYVKNEKVDISLPLQKYYFAKRLIDTGKGKRPRKGGPRLKWKLRTGNQGTAKDTGLYAIDDTNKVNVLIGAQQEWSMQTVNYIYDLAEDEFQSGPEEIISLMVENEQGLYNDFFELMETRWWTAPASSTVDPRPMSGLPFWIQKNATLGFNGGDPSGFTSGAGNIATGTYPRWKNYTGTYVTVDRDDLVEKVVNACDFCYFEPPRAYNEIGGGEADWELFTVHSVLATMRKLLENQNTNLGRNAGWGANGEVMVKGMPVNWVPALTNSDSDAYDSSAPFYGLNWNKFEYFFKSGWDMKKHPPKQAANQHNVRERHMDNHGNTVCYDRRQGGFVFYVA